MSKYRLWFSCFCSLIVFNAEAAERIGILKIFDQFIISNAAASQCIEIDDETATHFLSNFQMVTIHASQELAKQFPDFTEAQIAKSMERKSNLVTEKVIELVQIKGCNDPDIREVIRRFEVQAKWKPLN